MNKDLSEDLNLVVIGGFNYRSNEYSQEGLESLGQVVYGLLNTGILRQPNQKIFRGRNLNYQAE